MPKRHKITTALALFCVLLFSSRSALAADVYYLGGAGSGKSSAKNPSYSFKQRISDLLNFSKDKKTDDRSGRISGSVSQQVIHNDVSGNTSKSFLERGTDYITETNLNIQEKLGGDYNLESQINLRKTDDRRVDVRRDVRMKQFDLKIMNPRNLYEFGDFYADFSQFALGSSLEGAHVELSPTTAQKYQIVAARTSEADVVANKFQRNVAGVKADRNFFEESKTFSSFRMGLQAVTTQDDSSSLNRTSSTRDIKNTVISTDGDIAWRGPLALQYELAHSFYQSDEDAGKDTNKASALRVQPSLNFDKVGFRYLYYMAQPKFYTDQGSATADKMQHQWTMDYEFTEKASVNVVENYYWDHLPGSSQTKRTTNDEKYLTFNLKPFEGRPSLIIRPYVNYAQKNSDDGANSAEGVTRTAGLAFNDVMKEWALNYGAKYEYRSYKDEANNGSSSDYFHRVGLNFSREQKVFDRRLYLSLDPNMDFRRTKSDPDSDHDISLSLGFSSRYDISERWLFRAAHTLSDANNAKPSTDYMQTRTYSEFDFILGREKRAHFISRYEYNHYVHEDGQQSYNENRIIGKFLLNF